jgi:hypothetical protein
MFRLFLLKWYIRGVLLVLLATVTVAVIHRGYHYLRGRRNHDQGVPCIQCQRKAFPIGEMTNRYRCRICGCRFEGPAHF